MNAPIMMTCPHCGRVIKTRTNRFGDRIFNRHKMASIQDNKSKLEYDGQTFPVNSSITPIWEIDCPMSGQPIE